MILKKAEIKAYRNLSDVSVCFEDGINVIWGDNAQGKTNLLEAVYIFARGKPYRMKKESDVVPFGKNASSVEILYSSYGHDTEMSVEYFKNQKRRMKISGGEITKAAEFIGNFKAVLFCPEHLSIIKDSPGQRRNFLDIAISQTDKKYVYMLKKYNKLLMQRTALLKDCISLDGANSAVFEAFAEQIAEPCRYITEKRVQYCGRLDFYMKKSMAEMSEGRETVNISYESCFEDEITLEGAKNMYLDFLSREIQYKTSLYGPQRDDMEITVNGRSSRFYCSQGQQRSLSLCAKLAEGEISNEETGEYPVYLFDDVLSELDSKRTSYLLSKLENKQVIITSCNEELFSPFDIKNKVRIKDGHVII